MSFDGLSKLRQSDVSDAAADLGVTHSNSKSPVSQDEPNDFTKQHKESKSSQPLMQHSSLARIDTDPSRTSSINNNQRDMQEESCSDLTRSFDYQKEDQGALELSPS